MKKFLINEKAFTAVDLGLAMAAIIIFTIIMTSISYSVYSSSVEAKKTAVALNYAVDIFEHIGELDYDDVKAESGEIFDIESLNGFIQENVTTINDNQTIEGNIGTYSIELKIEDYNGENVIKIITLKITYLVSREKTDKVEMQRLKTIES